MTKLPLVRNHLLTEAATFAEVESAFPEPTLYGVTDGKAVGTYLEHKFRAYLAQRYAFAQGNSASGVDFPELAVDVKVTSVSQPQSSCPFKSARQKIFGLDYSLLVFVYEKWDDPALRAATLDIRHAIFIDAARTGDFTLTKQIRLMLEQGANEEDLIGLMSDRNLPLDDIEAKNIAEELTRSPPEQGYLTISNALQWRLQYKRVIVQAGLVDGIERVR